VGATITMNKIVGTNKISNILNFLKKA